MNKLKKIFCVLLLAIPGIAVHAQTTIPENADLMRSNGKIYVVVAIVITILTGLFFYVYNLDRKISRLEKK